MRYILSIIIALAIAGCSTKYEYDMDEFFKTYGDKNAEVGDLIERVSKQKIYFGHQSVGYNIIEGMNQWELETGLIISKVLSRDFNDTGDASFIHCIVGKNYDPKSKIDDFVALMETIPVDIQTVAFFKFCFVDISEATDVDELFEYYKEKMLGLQQNHSTIKLVLMTCPVTGVQKGVEGVARRILKRQPYSVSANIKRNEFNDMLKDEFSGVVPIFDLALIESTLPDGSIQTYSRKGKSCPGMPEYYTTDLGHLNDYGAKIVSYNLLAFLAEELK